MPLLPVTLLKRVMDTIHLNSCRDGNIILKSNLWKFFRALRVQANPLYCLLVASPVNYARVTLYDRKGLSASKVFTVSKFINSLSKMPSKGYRYSLSINLYYPKEDGLWQEGVYEASHLGELSVDLIKAHYSAVVSYHCLQYQKEGKIFELTPSVIGYYKFKLKYIKELQEIIQRNHIIFTNK